MKIEPALIVRVLEAIQSVSPGYFGVWFADKQSGLNLSYGCWKPKTKTCRMMGIADRRCFSGIGRAAT